MSLSLLVALLSTAAPDAGEGTRAGFSKDEARFAHTVYSEPAGLFLFTVVDVKTGALVEKVPLSDDEAHAKAQRLWKEGGFVAAPKVFKGAKIVRADARLWLELKGRRHELTNPFEGVGDGLGGKLTPTVWGASPSGRYVAISMDRDAGSHFGTARAFTFVDLKREK